MSGGGALADAPWSGCTDGLSLRINHREGGAISVREADRSVFEVSALGRLKRKSATTGPYHEAREFDVALLLVEAAQVTARSIPEWRSKYFQLAMRRGRKIAKVAMARRLAIALYWMWRKGWNYEQLTKFSSHAGKLETGDGVQKNIE